MTADPSTSSDLWSDLARPLPAWLPQAKLGIFIHWGAYSVPAWAEPSGPLGAVPEEEWFAHNAYAEWYANTIRIPGSPAAEHHREVHGDAPYDDFLDSWTADRFDPTAWAQLFAEAGAQYVVPTTKHHDGIALWDAPGTGTRNTVHRGPRRDLVGELATAARAAGLRFGVYYSGGLDWSISSFPPHTTSSAVSGLRPNDAAYNCYALLHVRDLMERYSPDVLWNDINWPDSGKRAGAWSLHELFADFYAGNPDGVVNDRWGQTHWDFRTSEYEHGTDVETGTDWEQCRGLGFSFGYNQVEDTSVVLSGHQLARLLGDVVSRGGRLLLNVGPTAAGEIPEIQQESLRALGRWMAPMAETVRASTRVDAAEATPSDEPWVRWLSTPDALVALVDQTGTTPLTFAAGAAQADRAELICGTGSVEATADGLTVRVDALADGPAAVRIPPLRMRSREIAGRAVALTELGFGAAVIGNLYHQTSDEVAAATVEAAWQAGIRYFDTAPHYGLGLSERRLGAALRDRPRDEFVVSSKVGRLLVPNEHPTGHDDDLFDVPDDLRRVRDYSRDGVRRSIEDTLTRTGLDRIDVVYVHDPDEYWAQAADEAMPALAELRDAGVIRAIGAGMNSTAMLTRFLRETAADVVMLAGRYTLLDHSGLDDVLPAALETHKSVVAVGVFNSGLLAQPQPPEDATFDYAPAAPELLERARRIAAVCERHGSSLPAAAVAFPLAHPAVVNVTLGMRTPAEVATNVGHLEREVPAAVWDELRDAGLLRPEAPVPHHRSPTTDHEEHR